MIFQALQSGLFRFELHSPCSKIVKIPEFNLGMHIHRVTDSEPKIGPSPTSLKWFLFVRADLNMTGVSGFLISLVINFLVNTKYFIEEILFRKIYCYEIIII